MDASTTPTTTETVDDSLNNTSNSTNVSMVITPNKIRNMISISMEFAIEATNMTYAMKEGIRTTIATLVQVPLKKIKIVSVRDTPSSYRRLLTVSSTVTVEISSLTETETVRVKQSVTPTAFNAIYQTSSGYPASTTLLVFVEQEPAAQSQDVYIVPVIISVALVVIVIIGLMFLKFRRSSITVINVHKSASDFTLLKDVRIDSSFSYCPVGLHD